MALLSDLERPCSFHRKKFGRLSAFLLAAAISLASCSVSDQDERTTTEAAASHAANSESSGADAGGSQAVASVDGVEIRASAGAGDSRRHLTISEGHATIPEAAARVASTKVVSLQMDEGKTQTISTGQSGVRSLGSS